MALEDCNFASQWVQAVLDNPDARIWLRACHEQFSGTVKVFRSVVLTQLLELTFEEAESLSDEDTEERLSASPGSEQRFKRAEPKIFEIAAGLQKSTAWMHLRPQFLEKLPRPTPMTKAEVWDCIKTGFLSSRRTFGECLPNFGDSLRKKCSQRRASSRLLLARLTGDQPSLDHSIIFDGEHLKVTWDRIERLDVTFWEMALPKKESRVLLYGSVTGHFSSRALRQVTRELCAVIRTALIAAVDLEQPKDAAAHPRLPVLTAEILANNSQFVTKLLTAYYASDEKKDSMNRRIRNCMVLMVEAYRQENEAIAMALYCSAMEALLGRKGADVTNTLADNAAALLESDPRHRADAVDFVKELYDTRSRILHGERLSTDDQSLRNARCLVCAMLLLVMERREFMVKAGFAAEKPDDFLAELRRSRFQEGQPVGSVAVKIVSLWRSGAKGSNINRQLPSA